MFVQLIGFKARQCRKKKFANMKPSDILETIMFLNTYEKNLCKIVLFNTNYHDLEYDIVYMMSK